MSKSSLASNTLMLYILTASNYVFGLISIPYLTRVLGAEVYGQVGFATAFSSYVQLILDFGFVLSATARVSRSADDGTEVSRVLTSVTLCKLGLAFAAGAVTAVLVATVSAFTADPALFVLYFLYVAVNSLVPDFLYRGMEVMSVVTGRTVLIKAVFVAGVFLLVRRPEDYLLVPTLYLAGSVVAVVAVLVHMRRRMGVWFMRVSVTDVLEAFRESVPFFGSRVASTFYSSLNTIVLGMALPGSAELGWYTAAMNVISAGRSLASPLADALYPHLVRTQDLRLLDRMLLVGEIVVFIGTVAVWILSPMLCPLLFGDGFVAAAPILRILLPLVPIALASYLLGFPALTPLGLERVANCSVVAGAVAQCTMLLILWATESITVMNVCAATVVTESLVLGVRAITYVKARHS